MQSKRTRHLLPLLVLPGNVVVVIPTLILLIGGSRGFGWGSPLLSVPAALCVATGISLMAWTVWLFHSRGNGTLAPWHPPEKLVVEGPYRHVRNPMISGIFFLLAAEALTFGSIAMVGWMALFVTAKLIYIRYHEEPELEERFGADYDVYRQNVPAWLPSPQGWPPERHTIHPPSGPLSEHPLSSP